MPEADRGASTPTAPSRVAPAERPSSGRPFVPRPLAPAVTADRNVIEAAVAVYRCGLNAGGQSGEAVKAAHGIASESAAFQAAESYLAVVFTAATVSATNVIKDLAGLAGPGEAP